MTKTFWRLGDKELTYIKEAIDTNMKGVMNKRFEEKFAETFGVKYAIGHNCGTAALHSCVYAADVRRGDEVIVPPLTFASPAFAVLLLGAVPVFADIDPETFTIDPKEIEKKITKKTKAIITVSLYGLPPDLDPIMKLAEKYNLKVIEDNAECYLGKYKGRIAGSIAHMSIFSFERSKILTTGHGGVAITNDDKLAETIRKHSIMGYATITSKEGISKATKEMLQNPFFERHHFVSPNYRMAEFIAAAALAQTERIEEFTSLRKKIGALYAGAVKGCNWIKPQKVPQGYEHAYWTFVFILEGEEYGISMKEFRETYLKEGGDSFYNAWLPNYLEPALRGIEFPDHKIKYEKGLCPITELIQPKIVQLKTNYETIDVAEQKAEALKRTIQKLEEKYKRR